MGEVKGYIKHKRSKQACRVVGERINDFCEVVLPRADRQSKEQALRCMDCGTPFCNYGCPVGNYIPEWNDLMSSGRWGEALELLEATNIMPEVTGRICPAMCEYACVLGINDDPVTIRENELSIIEHAFKNGLIKPRPPKKRTGKKVAVIGSGPAGLACAVMLNRLGHNVTVFEKDDRIGGIMRYGIPDFKLEKHILDRRMKIWENEGVEFRINENVQKLPKGYNAVCLAGGSRVPRDLKVEGRSLKGIHFAMEYLIQSNKRVANCHAPSHELIDAKGKKVVVIGGGDTGADCIGTANRQGAKSVVQIEILSKPSEARPADQPWPKYPLVFKTSTSHEEGCERHWLVTTKRFEGENGHIMRLICEKERKPLEIEADLVILAMGFLHPEKKGLIEELKLKLDQKGNIRTDEDHMTSNKGVFAAGDARRGQSLIVWAISEGINCARSIDGYLTGRRRVK